VLIFHDGLEAEWQLRLPEVVAAREGTFLTSPRTRMIWSVDSQGRWGYDWQTTGEYAASAYQQIGKRLPMIVGMEISPRMKVTPGRIDLTLRLRNVSTRTFHDVTADGGCLQHRSERFSTMRTPDLHPDRSGAHSSRPHRSHHSYPDEVFLRSGLVRRSGDARL